MKNEGQFVKKKVYPQVYISLADVRNLKLILSPVSLTFRQLYLALLFPFYCDRSNRFYELFPHSLSPLSIYVSIHLSFSLCLYVSIYISFFLSLPSYHIKGGKQGNKILYFDIFLKQRKSQLL